jgi:serine/threonine-protein kinase
VLDDEVTEDGAAFLVMELLEGENVEQRASRKGGVLSLVEALDVADQLLDVLAVAHEVGIVHRDIKPDNLFISQGGQLKVLDFGIARLRQGSVGSTRAGSFMGTPAFSAPEQARGRWNEVDCRSDVFAAGATLFSALTGRPVHDGETPSEQLALAISTPAPSLATVAPDLPADVVAIVDKALAYDKADRWANAREMQQAVRTALSALPASGPLSSPPRRASSPLVDRSAETLLDVSALRARPRTPSVRALTTTPASPQALASMRRIAAGVVLAGCTGLAVGLGSWWIAGLSSNAQAEPSGNGQAAVAQAARPEAGATTSAPPVVGASSSASAPELGTAPNGTSPDAALPSAEPDRKLRPNVAPSAASSNGVTGHKTPGSQPSRGERRNGPVQATPTTDRASSAAPSATDDPFDNRY